MYHFVAFLWDAQDRQARAAAKQLQRMLSMAKGNWTCLLRTNNVIVHGETPTHKAQCAYSMSNNTGVILGKVFKHGGNGTHQPLSPTFDESSSTAIIRSGGRQLVEGYWGNYVAFLRDEDHGSCLVIRDCSGKIPCFRVRHQNVEIVFSDIADLKPLQLPGFTINWSYIASFIYSSQMQIRASGLHEVTEVLAGDCLEVQGGFLYQFSIWDPRRVCRASSIESYEQAVDALRRVTQDCIDAWSSVYDTILHRLSGGLDSAIVLGSLRTGRKSANVTCLNIFGASPSEDERRYARRAAAQAGSRLIEHTSAALARPFDARLFSLPLATKPTLAPLLTAGDVQATNQIAMALKADAVWTGQGGDHLFFQNRTALSAEDYFLRYGVSFGLPAAIADAAKLSRIPYWLVLKQALKSKASQEAWAPDFVPRENAFFLNPDALPDNIAAYQAHPWTTNAESLPRGKQLQIYFLAEVVNRHRPLPNFEYTYEHHPLLSQPLIELCLQIPTYLLVNGGRSRALARDAFSDRVPIEILERETKGDTTPSVTNAIRGSREFLQDTLLDGILVREGIVKRQSLEPYISKNEPFKQGQMHPLLSCIASELWARSWAAESIAPTLTNDLGDLESSASHTFSA